MADEQKGVTREGWLLLYRTLMQQRRQLLAGVAVAVFGRPRQPLGPVEREDADRGHHLGAVDERQPFFRAQLDRSQASPPQRLPALPAWARAGTYGTARILVPVTELESFAPQRSTPPSESTPAPAEAVLAVPETAVVDTGTRRVVFVETMPGMFDGVEVTLGPRCGDYYPIRHGLSVGQKVATIGAFLIDAEARLSPDLAAAYFGAARSAESPASPASSDRKSVV